jgi:hypothetical protein
MSVSKPSPQFRASWSKAALKLLRQSDDPGCARTLSLIGKPLLDRFRAASVFDWMPAALHMEIVAAVGEERGREARGFWRDLMLINFGRGLLKPLLEGGLHIFGRSPHSILRMTPQTYYLVSRGCGTVTATPGEVPGSSRLLFTELPAELRVSLWSELCAGQCEAALRYLDMRGTAVSNEANLADGRLLVVTTPAP